MSVVGKIDCRLGNGIILAPETNQEVFVTLYRFLAQDMVAAGHCTIISSFFGTSASGFNYHDEANPAGENAWAVFRFPNSSTPFNILIQWADAETFGNGGGSPAALIGSTAIDGVGIDMALREDGTNAWAGTTDADGADTKASTVWSAGASTLHTLNRSNASGGSFNTNKQNTGRVAIDIVSAVHTRMHFVGNKDGFLFLWDLADDGGYGCSYLGKYTPLNNLTVNFPYVALINSVATAGILASTWNGATYGSTAGNTTSEGGIIGATTSNSTKTFRGIAAGPFQNFKFQPNSQFDPPRLDGQIFFLLQNETVSGSPGYLPPELVTLVYNIPGMSTNAAATRAYMATTTIEDLKWSIPWDRGSTPRTNTTRNGRSFVIT